MFVMFCKYNLSILQLIDGLFYLKTLYWEKYLTFAVELKNLSLS